MSFSSFYTDEVTQLKPLESEREQLLLSQAKDGDAHARQLLVRHKRKLVLDLAGRYAKNGVSQTLLVKEGALGLMRAVTRYQYEADESFTDFASKCITKQIHRVLREVV